jgi:hypothetical protein
MLTTTLQTIWGLLPKGENGEAQRGSAQRYWQGLLEALGKTGPDDEPITLLWILENCGRQSALSTTDAFPGHSRAIRLYACRCALSFADFLEKESSEGMPRLAVEAIEAAERCARGLGSADEMADAASQIEEQKQIGFGWRNLARLAALPAENPDFGNIIVQIHSEINGLRELENYAASVKANPYTLAGEAASEAAEAKFRAAVDKHREDMHREFIRLCKLEGEYGEVDLLDKT